MIFSFFKVTQYDGEAISGYLDREYRFDAETAAEINRAKGATTPFSLADDVLSGQGEKGKDGENGRDGIDGQSTYTIFTASSHETLPKPTGGQIRADGHLGGIPAGWHQVRPEYDQDQEERIFSSTFVGRPGDTVEWSIPVIETGPAGKKGDPGPPGPGLDTTAADARYLGVQTQNHLRVLLWTPDGQTDDIEGLIQVYSIANDWKSPNRIDFKGYIHGFTDVSQLVRVDINGTPFRLKVNSQAIASLLSYEYIRNGRFYFSALLSDRQVNNIASNVLLGNDLCFRFRLRLRIRVSVRLFTTGTSTTKVPSNYKYIDVNKLDGQIPEDRLPAIPASKLPPFVPVAHAPAVYDSGVVDVMHDTSTGLGAIEISYAFRRRSVLREISLLLCVCIKYYI